MFTPSSAAEFAGYHSIYALKKLIAGQFAPQMAFYGGEDEDLIRFMNETTGRTYEDTIQLFRTHQPEGANYGVFITDVPESARNPNFLAIQAFDYTKNWHISGAISYQNKKLFKPLTFGDPTIIDIQGPGPHDELRTMFNVVNGMKDNPDYLEVTKGHYKGQPVRNVL